MTFQVGDIVKVLYAPSGCMSNWPSMVGRIGVIEELHFEGTRALVRTITIDGAMHKLAFIWVRALERIHDPAWAVIVAEYQRREHINNGGKIKMNDPMKKPINPFEAAIHRCRGDVVTSIGIHNVQGLRKDWTKQRAEMFLRQHAEVIAHAMLAAGVEAIARLTEQTDAN